MAMHKIVGIRRNDARPETKQRGRVCQTEGCDTILSTYNADLLCAACEQANVRSPNRRRRRQPAWKVTEDHLADAADEPAVG
ncbi:MAG: hypothetical protein NVS3B21_23570 [Acidimicrobiales bacterium]